jgi:RNA polymerase sigma factor (TIGR02999 family)
MNSVFPDVDPSGGKSLLIGHEQPTPADELLPLVYDELRRLAVSRLSGERVGHTLQATELVHEAYLRLLGPNGEAQSWEHRGHFFAAAAEAMRRILIESVRKKNCLKRGRGAVRSSADAITLAAPEPHADALDLLALEEALTRLEVICPRRAAVVKLRYFAGLTIPQAAEALGIARSTADDDWAYAKSWLRVELADQAAPSVGLT